MILRSILYVFCTYQLYSQPVQSAVPDNQFVCMPGLLTLGVTSPKGDIMLEVGGTLEINCTLDLANPVVAGRTSKDIQFSVAKHEIPDDMLEKTIIDNSTAMLRVRNMKVSTPLVTCLLPDTPNITICENQIDVGYLPLPVENLNCVARNWASLNCTWDKPRNNIRTTYTISYGFRNYLMDCPNKISLSKTTESCEWNGRTEPHYRQNMRVITIVMTGANALKPEGIRWKYEFHNWEIVIPTTPERLAVEAISPHEIKVQWSFHNFKLFLPGLNHKITVCPLEPVHDCIVKGLKSKENTNLTERIVVPYANTKYRVEVRMKSQVANDTPDFWSPPAIHPSVQTLPKRPEFPPTTGIGTFELFNKYQLRDITIYWKRIPNYLHNGSNFYYKFTVFEENIQRRDIVPQLRSGLDYAFFGNLSLKSYKFEIQSANAEGESEEKATLFVPKSTEVPREPQSVSKVDYANGTYEISWRHQQEGGRDAAVTSYTVYRCLGSKVQCDELVEWIDVDPGKTHYIFDNLPPGGNHVFAVSANTKVASSGMVVATCELIHNKIPGKLKEVRGTHVSENSLQIRWGMDCSFKPGLVKAFRITYCQLRTNETTCLNSTQSREVLADGNSTSSTLENLDPYSSYIIWVSMATQAGESQTSDPLILQTMPAAPSDPPWVTTISTTNTSALLRIQPPIRTNGVIEKYEIVYSPTDSGSAEGRTHGPVETLETKLMDKDQGDVSYYNVTNLEANTNYTLRVAACTVSCSNASEPVYFHTGFGYTKLTAMPALTYEDGRILVSWRSPSHLGGPIEYYEVLVRKNGEISNPITIEYDPHRQTYFEAMDLKCEANTNVTARVRAISIIGSEQVFGNWSPEALFNCYANEVWFIWILIAIASLICFVMITLISLKFWRKLKVMHTLDVIAPPGLEQLQLNGFSERHGHRARQYSESDTPFHKDSLICQTTEYHQAETDDTKDFMPADSKENEKGGQEGTLELDTRGVHPSISMGGGIVIQNGTVGSDKCPIWLWNSPMTPPTNEAGDDFNAPPSNTQVSNGVNTLVQPSLPGQPPPNSDGLLDKEPSPSPSNPLISDSSATNSGDEDGDDHYRTLNFEPYGSLSYYNGDTPYDNSNPVHMTNGEDDSGSYDYTKGGSLPNHSNGIIPNGQLPEISKDSAYVKWTSLKLDPIVGPGVVNGKAPYCQVGILLEQ